MTTFESILLLAVTACVIITAFGVLVIKRMLEEIIDRKDANYEILNNIRGDTLDILQELNNIEDNNDQDFKKLIDIVDKMHRNLCVEIADKIVNKMYPVNEGEPLDAAFEPDYKLKKDIECKLNGFAAAVLDAECCTKEIVDFWLERICDAAHKYIKQLKIDCDKLSKEQQDEFLKRLIMPNYDKPFQPIYTPCYAPNGICTNPQMDCIGCPKHRSSGGTWITSTNNINED